MTETLRVSSIDPDHTKWKDPGNDVADLASWRIDAWAWLTREPSQIESRLILRWLANEGIFAQILNQRGVHFETSPDGFAEDTNTVRRLVIIAGREAPRIVKENEQMNEQLQAEIKRINDELSNG
ncbi:hypothetical protein [Terrabacter terrigena]|uniref:Uncharacterized protein n=1 Tax=Terrabacter terrigena TaxID=574718 RepID=A0ABW3MXT9_9MICO